MYHILNNKTAIQDGGKSNLNKRSYISAFIYASLLFIYTLEAAGYIKDKESVDRIRSKDSGFFAIFIAFSVLIPIIMLILVFGVVVKKKAESYVNFAIWAFMVAHLTLTLVAFGFAEPDVKPSVKGFTFTRVVFLFISMALALQGAKVHNKSEYGSIEGKNK